MVISDIDLVHTFVAQRYDEVYPWDRGYRLGTKNNIVVEDELRIYLIRTVYQKFLYQDGLLLVPLHVNELVVGHCEISMVLNVRKLPIS